ncbi:MAG: septal ring lytic transglycosylase RlpA family protein [Synechococcus sp.]|nr:septal ring lytic transglycosylase RlpA family protein [Synechococcus sp.]
MRSTISLGIVTALLSGAGTILPAMAEAGRSMPLSLEGALKSMAPEEAVSPVSLSSSQRNATQVAIREAEGKAPAERPSLLQQAPVLPLASAPTPAVQVAQVINGQASWYGPGFFGNRTASGEVFRPGTLTAAHRTLPFGTRVRVTNIHNGRTAVVRINDRGPFHGNRVIDLAHGAAQDLGLVSSGVAQVKLEVLR